jgi:DnaJ-like protein
MSPIRRDGEGRPQAGPTWESLIDRQIREGMEAGQFDDLPLQGRRIPIDDDGSELALAHHLLRQAGYAPGWVAIDAEIRTLLARRDALRLRAARRGAPVQARDREELATLVGAINDLVLGLEHEAPTVRQHRRRLDPATELAALETAAREGPSTA